MQIQAVKTADGKVWWVAFTSFDEELRGEGSGEVYVSGGSGTDFQNCTDSTGN